MIDIIHHMKKKLTIIYNFSYSKWYVFKRSHVKVSCWKLCIILHFESDWFPGHINCSTPRRRSPKHAVQTKLQCRNRNESLGIWPTYRLMCRWCCKIYLRITLNQKIEQWLTLSGRQSSKHKRMKHEVAAVRFLTEVEVNHFKYWLLPFSIYY